MAADKPHSVKFADLAKQPDAIDLLAMALEEWALCEALVIIHGKERGLQRYFEAGGHVFPDQDGEIWIRRPRRDRR